MKFPTNHFLALRPDHFEVEPAGSIGWKGGYIVFRYKCTENLQNVGTYFAKFGHKPAETSPVAGTSGMSGAQTSLSPIEGERRKLRRTLTERRRRPITAACILKRMHQILRGTNKMLISSVPVLVHSQAGSHRKPCIAQMCGAQTRLRASSMTTFARLF